MCVCVAAYLYCTTFRYEYPKVPSRPLHTCVFRRQMGYISNASRWTFSLRTYNCFIFFCDYLWTTNRDFRFRYKYLSPKNYFQAILLPIAEYTHHVCSVGLVKNSWQLLTTRSEKPLVRTNLPPKYNTQRAHVSVSTISVGSFFLSFFRISVT